MLVARYSKRLVRLAGHALCTAVALSALAQSAAAQPDETYVLGPEDVFTVTVVKRPEFSGDFLVPSAGLVDLPAVGTFKAAGLSLAEVASHVRTQLLKRLKNPEVSVSLKVARVRRISVLGGVAKPGQYELKPGWRVTEAVGAGGGLPKDTLAKDYKAYVLRAKDGTKAELNLVEALAGTSEHNVLLNEGDVLTLEAVESIPIYVVGKVKTPQLYRLPRENAGLIEALMMAGGVTDDAAVSNIKILRVSGKEEVVDLVPVLLRGEKRELPKLEAGDLVVVPEAEARVAVFGSVLAPGFVAIPEGKELRLVDAVSVAKIDPKRSRLSRVGLVRKEGGKEQRMEIDLGKFMKTGDSKLNPVLMNGDVIYIPESDGFDWKTASPLVSLGAILFRVFGG